MFFPLIEIAKDTLFEYPESNHISFIIKKKRNIICCGVNYKFKTSPIAKKFGHRFSSLHSELVAIKKFPYPLKEIVNYKMINLRIRKDGSLGISAPCIFCQRMLYFFGVREVWYSTGVSENFGKIIL